LLLAKRVVPDATVEVVAAAVAAIASVAPVAAGGGVIGVAVQVAVALAIPPVRILTTVALFTLQLAQLVSAIMINDLQMLVCHLCVLPGMYHVVVARSWYTKGHAAGAWAIAGGQVLYRTPGVTTWRVQ
jgi:hypothetical protein